MTQLAPVAAGVGAAPGTKYASWAPAAYEVALRSRVVFPVVCVIDGKSRSDTLRDIMTCLASDQVSDPACGTSPGHAKNLPQFLIRRTIAKRGNDWMRGAFLHRYALAINLLRSTQANRVLCRELNREAQVWIVQASVKGLLAIIPMQR